MRHREFAELAAPGERYDWDGAFTCEALRGEEAGVVLAGRG